VVGEHCAKTLLLKVWMYHRAPAVYSILSHVA
jgi:hypothetical protein